jgi:hypothetical protein
MQMKAVFGVLSFLGALASLCAAVAVIVFTVVVGERRLATVTSAVWQWLFGGWGLARKVLVAALVLVTGYFAVLLAFSFLSREIVLSPGQEKYFCEIDCHLAYSVTSVAGTESVAEPASEANTGRSFLVVSVKTRFDEKTISPYRGNTPLAPNPLRRVTLVDDQGREYAVSASGQQALEAARGAGTPLSESLRPGESYETKLVFEVPVAAKNLRVLVSSPTRPEWLAHFVIGEEASFLHKKVLLAMPL